MKTKASPLLPLFRSSAQARVVEKIFSETHPQGLSLRALSAEAAVPLGTVHREVNRLEEAGLVQSLRIGRERRVLPNRDSPLYPELRGLVLKAFGPASVLRPLLERLSGVEKAYLYGSWARRYRGEPGPAPYDIDLLVIGNPEPDDVYSACRRAEDELGLPVDATILTAEEWQSSETGFLRTVREGPLVEVV